MIRLAPVFFLIFKIWMIVDAAKKNMPIHWFLIIIFLPLGEFVYFFMEKLPELTKKEYSYSTIK